MMIPAPMPVSVLVTMSSVSVRESVQPIPPMRNMVQPSTNSRILLWRTLHRPASSIKGIIISEGSDSSISTSSFEAEGNMVSRSSRMGDMANPGSDTTADTDHIEISAIRGIVPFPVVTFIADVLEAMSNSYAEYTRVAERCFLSIAVAHTARDVGKGAKCGP